MKKNIVSLILIVIAFGYEVNAQQSFTYNQYMNNLTPRLPVSSLLDRSPSLALTTRQQWAGIDGAPKTSIFTGTLPVTRHNMSAGAFVILDEVGVEKTTEVNFFFAKGVQLRERTWLAVSLNGGIRSYKTNYASLDLTDQAYRNDVNQTKGLLGLSAMIYNPEKYYLGFSVPQVNIGSEGFGVGDDTRNWGSTWVASAGYLRPIGTSFDFKPAALLTYSKDQKLLDLSATFYWMKQLGLGVNYRTSKETTGIVSYTHKHRIMMGYSYTLAGSGSEVSGMSNGSHELSLRVRFGKELSPKLL